MSRVWMITGAGRGLGRAFAEGDPEKAAKFLYRIVDGGKLPKRILIGKKCCEAVRDYLKDRIAEIDSYIEESSQTDFE